MQGISSVYAYRGVILLTLALLTDPSSQPVTYAQLIIVLLYRMQVSTLRLSTPLPHRVTDKTGLLALTLVSHSRPATHNEVLYDWVQPQR